LSLSVKDEDGEPVAHASVLLHRGGVVIPRSILSGHLTLLGLPWETDTWGRLVIPALAPGAYDVFLAGSTSEEAVALGRTDGHLGAFDLLPSTASELAVTVAGSPPVIERPPAE
jgi:hypothetical protein